MPNNVKKAQGKNMKRERIGPKIKKIRKAHNLSQKDLADALGYSDKSMITHIEKGDSDMTYEKMLLLLREYMLSANELFDVSDIDRLIKKHQKEKQNELIQKLFFNPTIDYMKVIKEIDYKNLLCNKDIYLKPILSDDDLRYCFLDLQLGEEQKDFVNPPYISISRAYISPFNYYPFIICLKDDTKIGFICLNKWLPKKETFSFSFLIDKSYQHKGYGTSTIKLAIELFKIMDSNLEIKIAVEESNKKAQKLYETLGFMNTNELDGDDLVFSYKPI